MSKPQLFCFTYAGGTKDFFNIIEPSLEGVEVNSFDYAGHGERHNEKFYQNFDELADDIFYQFKNKLNGRYSLFGYSMGSITVVEILRKIIGAGLPLPDNLFMAAHEPHTKSELLGYTAEELDEWVKDRTIKFGAVPEKLLNNKVFWRTYLPVYRADYSIIGTYKFEELALKTDIPATIFYSETDTPLSEMKQWEKFFPCEFYQFPGTHFFIRENYEEMAMIIRTKMGVPL